MIGDAVAPLPNVLIVGLNYAPEAVGIGPFTQGMAQGLARRGFAVEVIAGKPYYPQWRASPGFAASAWMASTEHGVRIVRCPHYIPRNPGGLRRIVHLASFALAALMPALRAALRPRADRPGVVICIAPALLSVPVAWIAARLAGAELWLHVQDFEVEAAFATGLVGGHGWAARLARGVENALLRLADRLSTISPQMCAKLVAKGIDPARVIEIRNWANAPAPDPQAGDRKSVV